VSDLSPLENFSLEEDFEDMDELAFDLDEKLDDIEVETAGDNLARNERP